MLRTIAQILNYVSLQGQIENFDDIHESIKHGISFRGTNIWILVCAIIIASVGLNTNSTAVIIGAMLISPLMGPINGMGYSVAIHDFQLLKQSLKNFGFALLASIAASTLYFAITPVQTAHSELLARTSPTIYDVLIALFGGFAGIIAISTKNKGNVIPGVAIATALMPPLCTAGYGLATMQFSFFYGAFYLFAINTVCIAYASLLVSQMLKFPIRNTQISERRKKRINQILSGILIIIILPSIYLGYIMAQNEKFRANAEEYTKYVGINKGNYLLKNEISASNKEIKLVYGGASLSDDDKQFIIDQAELFSLKDANILVEQGLTIDIDLSDVEKKLNAQTQETNLRQEIARLNLVIEDYKQRSDSIHDRQTKGKQLLAELTPLYPDIVDTSYADTYVYSQTDSLMEVKMGIFTVTSKRYIPQSEQTKIKNWLLQRIDIQEAKVYFEVKK